MAASPQILARITALLSRASDKGATEEERRTSAVLAAELMRKHGVTIREPQPPPPPPATDPSGIESLNAQADAWLAQQRSTKVGALVLGALDDPRARQALDHLADRALDWLLGGRVPPPKTRVRAIKRARRKPAP